MRGGIEGEVNCRTMLEDSVHCMTGSFEGASFHYIMGKTAERGSLSSAFQIKKGDSGFPWLHEMLYILHRKENREVQQSVRAKKYERHTFIFFAPTLFAQLNRSLQ